MLFPTPSSLPIDSLCLSALIYWCITLLMRMIVGLLGDGNCKWRDRYVKKLQQERKETSLNTCAGHILYHICIAPQEEVPRLYLPPKVLTQQASALRYEPTEHSKWRISRTQQDFVHKTSSSSSSCVSTSLLCCTGAATSWCWCCGIVGGRKTASEEIDMPNNRENSLNTCAGHILYNI